MKKMFVFLQMIIISSILCFFVRVNVSADSPNIYYFSDSSNYINVVNDLVSNTSLKNSNIKEDKIDDFYTNINYLIENYSDLENKIIIFEMTQGFSAEIYKGNGSTMPEKLETLFSTWKGHNCKIMFINGTDESRYLICNDFLDYVDFHIILDVKHVFMMNVFYYLEQEFDFPPHNYDLLFDELFVKNVFGDEGYDIILNEYLLPYINTRYDDINSGYTMADALKKNGARIYIPRFDFQSIVEISSGEEYDFYNIFDFNTNGFIVTSSDGDNETKLDYYDSFGANSIFYYDYDCINSENYIKNQNTKFYQCNPYNRSSIVEMIISFIFEDYSIWSQYNNWAGRCDVTHLMTGDGENGWLHNFIEGEGDFLNCWALIKTEE